MHQTNAIAKTILTSAVMLTVTAIVLSLIYTTEPEAQKDGASKRTPMLVKVIAADMGNHIPLIRTYGVVKPSRRVALMPRVSGQVVEVSPQFVPGNIVQKNQWLIKIDPTDFKLALRRAESELIKAESAYAIEKGEQIRAQRAFELVSDSIARDNKALILRQPQLKRAEAELETARVLVAQAQVELERTTVKMPFDGQILSRHSNLGSQLSPNSMLGDVIGSQVYWIESSIPLSQLAWLAPPSDQASATNVVIRTTTTSNNNKQMGRLIQIISTLDEQSRMARVLIEVDDPLGLKASNEQISKIALFAGSYVETDLPARAIPTSVKLPIEYLRKRDTVWIMRDGKLDIRQVVVSYRDENYAYITKGIDANESIITTDISTVRQGARVQLKSLSSANASAD